jgi:hypothetical protein
VGVVVQGRYFYILGALCCLYNLNAPFRFKIDIIKNYFRPFNPNLIPLKPNLSFFSGGFVFNLFIESICNILPLWIVATLL